MLVLWLEADPLRQEVRPLAADAFDSDSHGEGIAGTRRRLGESRLGVPKGPVPVVARRGDRGTMTGLVSRAALLRGDPAVPSRHGARPALTPARPVPGSS